MRVNTLRIPCADLGASERFYADFIGREKSFGSSDTGFVGFELANAQILLEPEERDEFECGRYLGFSLDVEDLETFYRDRTARGIRFTGPPQKQPWGGVMTHVEDCNGNTFSLVESTST